MTHGVIGLLLGVALVQCLLGFSDAKHQIIVMDHGNEPAVTFCELGWKDKCLDYSCAVQ